MRALHRASLCLVIDTATLGPLGSQEQVAEARTRLRASTPSLSIWHKGCLVGAGNRGHGHVSLTFHQKSLPSAQTSCWLPPPKPLHTAGLPLGRCRGPSGTERRRAAQEQAPPHCNRVTSTGVPRHLTPGLQSTSAISTHVILGFSLLTCELGTQSMRPLAAHTSPAGWAVRTKMDPFYRSGN